MKSFKDYLKEAEEQQAELPPEEEPAAPVRKPRYKWQTGPLVTDFGHPGWGPESDEATRQAWYKTDARKQHDAARNAHHAAQMAAMHAHTGVKPEDFDLTIDEFPNPQYRADGTDDEDDPNYEPELISLGVDYDYSYHGKYYAATMIDPAEYPELEISIKRVIDLENGEDLTKSIDLSEVEKYIENEIPSWEEEARNARDEAAIDRWESSRDDYYESVGRIRKLSGL